MFKVNLEDSTWLVVLPLNTLSALTPLIERLLLVSRWPFTQMAWLPKPALLPEVLMKSALKPGLKIASCVKLPVPRGVSWSSLEYPTP